ncbi:uncharacterized protein LOC135197912 [Macrobrachium nipponense]|uniref:uncharacterized protein LOC135197912 n=1 Tax=Macrobrachium nipponense TaxID=159736 RepID=UPI0030C7E622
MKLMVLITSYIGAITAPLLGMVPQNSGCAKRVRITSQSRKIILNVHRYFRSLDERECETSVNEKTAAATGVSMSTISLIKRQAKEGRIESPPPRMRCSPITGSADGVEEEDIRKAVLSFYERGELPTMDTVMEMLKEPPFRFVGAKTSLRRVIEHLGFRCRRIQGGRVVLIERNAVVAARNKYFRLLQENRSSINPRPEIYVYKTWVNLQESVVKQKQKALNECLVIVHAGGEEGFLPGAFLMFRSRSKMKGHDPIDSESFRSWFKNQLLPCVPFQSLIIMDCSPSQSTVLNQVPTRSSRKCDIIKWLTQNNIKHDSFLSKAELLQFVSLHKDRQVYEIDGIAKKSGHKVIRIPPFHYYLNPIEFIWQKVKLAIKKENYECSQTLGRVEEISKSVIDNVSKEEWKRFIGCSRDAEEGYRKKDLAAEFALKSFVLSCDDLSSDSDDECLS